MTGPNHFVGGLVFTGIFTSFWSTNIFSNPWFLSFAMICTQLPDIDHTKSLIGKTVYPLAHWLQRNFGHRTITHSFLFLIIGTIGTTVIEVMFIHPQWDYGRIFFFAVLSHYILDMVTIQGVPLFYPWARNPCVIPGNPDFRLRTNDYKAEAKAFLLFGLIGVFCIPLFEHGFWTAYNRGFGTLKHVHTERMNSKTQVLIDYNFTMNGTDFIGTGTLVDSKQTWALISDQGVLHELDRSNPAQVINSVKPRKTDKPYMIREVVFQNINLDSLNNLLRPVIATGEVNSSQEVQWREQGIVIQGKTIALDHNVGFQVSKLADDGASNLKSRLAVLEAKLQRERSSYSYAWGEIRRDKAELKKIEDLLKKETDWLEISRLQKKRKSLASVNSKVIPPYKSDPVILAEIEQIKVKMETFKHTTFSGYVRFPVL